MTTSGTSGSTGPAADGQPDDDTAEQWEVLLDEVRDCAVHMLCEVSDRTRDNITLARKGEYGLKNWLDDVRWFWERVADESANAAQGFRERTGD